MRFTLILLTTSVYAQSNWLGAGTAWNQYARPEVNGWLCWATTINHGQQIFATASWDVTSSTKRPYTVQTSFRPGFATILRKVGPISIIALGDAGIAASGGTLDGAFSGGGYVLFPIGKTTWSIIAGARQLKVSQQPGQQVFEFGIGKRY
jgi:hypothetical protein